MASLAKSSQKVNANFGHGLAYVWSSILQGHLALSHVLLSHWNFFGHVPQLLPTINFVTFWSITDWQIVRGKAFFSEYCRKLRLILFRWLNFSLQCEWSKNKTNSEIYLLCLRQVENVTISVWDSDCNWLERFFILRHCSFCQLSLPGNQSYELHYLGFVSSCVHHHFMLWSEPVSRKALPCHDNNPPYFFCCLAEENLAPQQFGKPVCCQCYSPGNGDSVDGGGQWQMLAAAAQQAQFPSLNLGSCQRVKSAATTSYIFFLGRRRAQCSLMNISGHTQALIVQ